MIARVDVHLHDPVAGNAQQFLLLVAVKLDHKQRDTKVRQALPRPDVVQLGIDQRQVLHVGVRLQHPQDGLIFKLFRVPRRQILVGFDIVRIDGDCRRLGGLLHAQERLDAGDLAVVRTVRQGTTLGR